MMFTYPILFADSIADFDRGGIYQKQQERHGYELRRQPTAQLQLGIGIIQYRFLFFSN
jgi:hypothetical protein